MVAKTPLKCVGLGAGYFSHYQYDSWYRIQGIEIAAICDRDQARAAAIMGKFGIPTYYASYEDMFDAEKPNFVDIITPPETHFEICTAAIERGIDIVCQKPLAPSYAESASIVNAAQRAGIRFMVHENWRWQPWYREIKRLIEADVLGEVFTINFRMRTGDGWGDDAYLSRQPFFRNYPQLLVYETGVHFIDTFRYLLGEIESVYARLRRLNPVIKGEDSGQLIFGFASGATAIWDSNRYNESEADNPRYTFGELRMDGSRGHLNLDTNGDIFIKHLGRPASQHEYRHRDVGFAGDCVHRLQEHFVDCVRNGTPFESTGEDYLRTIRVVEACYESAGSGEVVRL